MFHLFDESLAFFEADPTQYQFYYASVLFFQSSTCQATDSNHITLLIVIRCDSLILKKSKAFNLFNAIPTTPILVL